MSWNNKIVWSEGMFLQPQHFQQHDRYIEHLVEARVGPVTCYPWGFATLTLDEAALKLGKLAIAHASGVLPDGTPFDFPNTDPPVAPLDIPEDARDERVLLAVPLRRPGADEVDLAETDDAGLTRYAVSPIEVHDHNVGAGQPATVQIGRLRLRLLLQREVTDAYACLGVARVVERRPDNQVVLSPGYIPPTLATLDNPTLRDFLRDILGLLQQRGDALAARLAQPGRGGVAEIADFLWLQSVNRFQPVLAHLIQTASLHPERAYDFLLMLAGDLSTFSRDARRPPAYPVYRHDDLESCFGPLIEDLRRSLSTVLEQHAIAIELQERQFGVRVAIVRDLELLRGASLVLAVNAQLPAEALRTRFPTQVKIGPVEKIRDLVNLALPGIGLRALPVAPRQIPYHAGFNYFELERGGELWKQFEKSGGLAMHIAGEFPGIELEFWAIRE